jgi:hypothetical protein
MSVQSHPAAAFFLKSVEQFQTEGHTVRIVLEHVLRKGVSKEFP